MPPTLAAPITFIEVTVEFVAVSECKTVLPPTFKLPPMPVPPRICNAPELVLSDSVTFEIVVAFLI